MGQLLALDQLTPSPAWHLKKAYWDSDYKRTPWSKEMGGWRHNDIVNDPMIAKALFIHRDHVQNEPWDDDLTTVRVDIRRWIERHLEDTVIYHHEDMAYTYFMYRKGMASYDRDARNMKHGYHAFLFESDASALLFKMHYGHLVTDTMNPLHPDHHGLRSLRARPRNCGPGYMNGLGELIDFDSTECD